MRSLFTSVSVLAVFALLALAGCGDDASPEPDATSAESDHDHEVDHDEDHEHGELYEPNTPDPDADAAAVADAWLAAFADSGAEDTATWLAGLEPYCFATYCELLAQTDAAAIPTEAATGPAELAETDRADAVVATAPAEDGTWTVSLLATTGGDWQVWDCAWEVS